MTMPSEKPLGYIPSNRSHENRRASKPLMEKRRRARINQSLSELKSLILDAVKKDVQNSSRHSKLEKADILEMTVKHLQALHRHRTNVSAANMPAISKFRAGFAECAKEVTRFVEHVDPELKSRLLSHLSNCLSAVADSGEPDRPGSADTSSSSSCGEPCGSPGPTTFHHLTLVMPGHSSEMPLNLATNSSRDAVDEDYFSDNDVPSLRPKQEMLRQVEPLPHEDPVWRPW